MTTSKPPKYLSSIFNSYYYKEDESSGFTQNEADLRYLRKNTTDTATALQTFNAGLTCAVGTTLTASSIMANILETTSSVKCNVYQSSSINQALTLGNNQIGSGAKLEIGCNPGRLGSINIANTQTTGTGNIIIGTQLSTLTTGSQDILINRPLTIGYNAVSELNNTFDKIGSYISATSNEAIIVNNALSATSLVNFTNVPAGIYLFNYQINYRLTITSTVFTQQKFILSTTQNDFIPGNIIGGQFSSLFKTNQEVVATSVPVTDYTQSNSKCGTIVLSGMSNIYLNYRIVYNATTTVPYIIGSLRLVRIG